MDHSDLLDQRLLNQRISSKAQSPDSVVSGLGAIQAQDYPAALWAIGLRSRSATRPIVEAAVVGRKITRTWLMRGTLHFASSRDIGWMLKLFSPRLIRTAEHRDRSLGLSNETVALTRRLFRNALQGGRQLTRGQMYEVMEAGGVPSSNNLGYHMLYRAAWDGLICFGPHTGKEQTFVLAEEWLPKTSPLKQEEALRELAVRYFTSHGPASVKDFIWWSGLTVSEARLGIERASSKLREEAEDGTAYYAPKSSGAKAARDSIYLLPPFDEYLVGYSDRSAILGSRSTQNWIRRAKIPVVTSNGMFLPTLIVDGMVAGVWKRASAKGGMVVTLRPFIKLGASQIAEAKERAEEYGSFFESRAILKIAA
jgi:hypothetical protein